MSLHGLLPLEDAEGQKKIIAVESEYNIYTCNSFNWRIMKSYR